MSDPKKRTAPSQKSWLPITLILLLLIGIGLLLWYFALAPREPAVSYRPPAPAPTELAGPPTGPAPLFPDLFTEGLPTPFSPPGEEGREADECDIIGDRIEAFFNRLDQRDYLRQRAPAGGSQAFFQGMLDRLLVNPPVVSGETDDISVLLRNTAHFYRVLGAKDLWLLKEILTNERAELERIMALFYQWSLIAPDCPNDDLDFHLPLPAAYEYAGFFLNTLGGRSYLFRRAATARLLVTYYSVLILDRANEAGINRHGLDIRYGINNLLAEMPGAGAIEQRHEYLAILTALDDKYQRRYGN